MKKIFQYIMLAVVTIVMASCTSDIEETTAIAGKSNVQLVVTGGCHYQSSKI